MPDVRFTYNLASARYRGPDGRFVPAARVRDGVDVAAAAASARMADLSARLRSGQITLADWQTQMMAEVKYSHVANGIAAYGGTAEMSPSRYGFLGSQVKDDYQRLRSFADEIRSGTMALDGRLEARARLYGQASRIVFESVRSREDRIQGMTEERNVLHASQSCSACKAVSAQGWVPIGTLAPIGSRTCGPNCRCTMQRRSAAEAAA